MAYIGNSCIYIGSTEWGIGSTDGDEVPVAVVASTEITGAINATVILDASESYTDDPDDVLYFEWELDSSPLGSTSLIIGEGSRVQIVPDLAGAYLVSLVVRGAKSGCSDPVLIAINATSALTAWSQKTYIDYSWIWQLLPDFWSLTSEIDRKKIENFWNGIGQVAAADLLGLYNTDINKSIATIQDKVLRRWLKIDPVLPVRNTTFVLNLPADVELLSDGSSTCTLSSYPLISGDIPISCVFTSTQTITPDSSLLSDVGRTIYVDYNGRRTSHGITGVVDGTWSVSPNLPFQNYPVSGFCSFTNNGATDVLYSQGRVENIVSRDGLTLSLANSIDSEDGTFFCVLKTTEDLVKEGVSPGDVLVSKITNIEETYSITVHSEVVAVTPTRVLFRPSLENAAWLTAENIESAKTTFFKDADLRDRQVRTFTRIFNGSATFRRRYMNTELRAQDVIVAGDFSFRLIPSHIIRNTKIRLSDNILSAVTLNEFITPVSVSNGIVQSEFGAALDLGRDQVELRENSDYVVTSFTYYGGGLNAVAGSFEITSDTADFEIHDVFPGDTLYILSGSSVGQYRILGVDGFKLTLDRPIPRDLVEDDFRVERSYPANFIRFASPFPAEFPCPTLWAETYIMDNGEKIQSNFGEAVKLTKEDHTAWGTANSYKSVVSAMLRVKMLGPNFETFVRSISTAIGLPTSEVTGVIRNIERGVLAAGKRSRIVIEDLTPGGEPNGFYRIYTYRETTEDDLDNLTGLSNNPSTGRPWQVGDVVLEGEILSNGVQVEDRLTSREFPVVGVLGYHVFRLLLNTDGYRMGSDGIDYLIRFMREARPHYVWIISALVKYLVDYIEIESEVFFKFRALLFDDAYNINTGANIFDEFLQGFQRFDSINVMARSIWRTGDLNIRAGGRVFSATGGFLNGVEHTDFGISSPVAVGDKLVIPSGPYKGICTITEVIDDNTLQTNSTIFTVDNDTPTQFEVVRETAGVRAVQFTSDGETLNLLDSPQDLRSSDVGPGDLVQILDTYHIVSAVDLEQNKLTLVPDMSVAAETIDTTVVRPCIRPDVIFEGDVLIVDAKLFVFARRYGVLVGDTLVCEGRQYRITALDVEGNVYTYPKIADGVRTVTIHASLNSDALDALDRTLRQIEDVVTFKFKGAGAVIGASATNPVANYIPFGPSFQLAQYPVTVGDIIYIAVEFVDIGEGSGIFRVVDIDAGGVYTNYHFLANKPVGFELWKHTPGWIREI
jgi:hypothetical protein